EMEAAPQLTLDGFHDERRLMPEQMHAEAHRDIDVLVAVEVPHPRAARALGDNRIEHLLEHRLEANRSAVVGEMRTMASGEVLRFARARDELRDEIADVRFLLRRERCRRVRAG